MSSHRAAPQPSPIRRRWDAFVRWLTDDADWDAYDCPEYERTRPADLGQS